MTIDPQLRQAAPDLSLGIIAASVVVTKHENQLWNEIDDQVKEISKTVKLDTLASAPQVAELRSAYRALGKDPSRYRGSQEALARRILQGRGLYQVNTVVDINNLVSLESMCSVGSYDVRNISSPSAFRVGQKGETYRGIGKDVINIEGLPVFADEMGPFGSPTSDSERAMITLTTRDVAMVIISFGGYQDLDKRVSRAKSLLERYAQASGVASRIVR